MSYLKDFFDLKFIKMSKICIQYMHGISFRVELTKWKFSIKIYGFWKKVFICQPKEFLDQTNYVTKLVDLLKVRNRIRLIWEIFQLYTNWVVHGGNHFSNFRRYQKITPVHCCKNRIIFLLDAAFCSMLCRIYTYVTY